MSPEADRIASSSSLVKCAVLSFQSSLYAFIPVAIRRFHSVLSYTNSNTVQFPCIVGVSATLSAEVSEGKSAAVFQFRGF